MNVKRHSGQRVFLMIYSISLLSKHFYFLKFTVLRCTRWVRLGALAAPPVPQWDRYRAPASASLGEEGQPSLAVSWPADKPWKQKAENPPGALGLKTAQADTASGRMPGAGSRRARPRAGGAGLRFAWSGHTLGVGAQGLKDTRNPSVHTDAFSFQWNRGRRGTALQGPDEITGLCYSADLVPPSYYFLLYL